MTDCRSFAEEGPGGLQFSPAQFGNIVWAEGGRRVAMERSVGIDTHTKAHTHLFEQVDAGLAPGFHGTEMAGGRR